MGIIRGKGNGLRIYDMRVIISNAYRLPVGSHGGHLSQFEAYDLFKIVAQFVLERSGIDRKLIDGVIVGNIGQPSDHPNIARKVARELLGDDKWGFVVQRNCASGIQAITTAYEMIKNNDARILLVGGAESMSRAPYLLKKARWGYRLRNDVLYDGLWEGLTDPVVNQLMGRTAENLVEKYNLSREEMDEFSVKSHQKAYKAQKEGLFSSRIAPVNVDGKTIDKDEGINPNLTMQIASMYPAIFKEGGKVTPASSSSINDGAAAMIITTEEIAKEIGLKIDAVIVSYAYGAVHPAYMGEGPTCSTPIALRKAGLKITDIDYFEVNEAFAAVAIVDRNVLGIPDERMNVWGGAIALGHPVGATGSILVAKLIGILEHYNAKRGLVTMCVGGGQGGTLIIERYEN